MKSGELITLAGTLVSLGILFGYDRLIGYSFIGAGVLLSIISALKSRKKRANIFWGGGGELLKKNGGINSWQHVMLTLGVTVCLVGAFLVGWGESILGENHTGFATMIGIVGMGIITKAKRSNKS